jgi:hypothetical protein
MCWGWSSEKDRKDRWKSGGPVFRVLWVCDNVVDDLQNNADQISKYLKGVYREHSHDPLHLGKLRTQPVT